MHTRTQSQVRIHIGILTNARVNDEHPGAAMMKEVQTSVKTRVSVDPCVPQPVRDRIGKTFELSKIGLGKGKRR
jgi:hypothetical protein